MKKPTPGYKTLNCLIKDEPVFVLRAKDNFSVAMLRLMQNVYGIDDSVIEMFEDWRRRNPEFCKDPD